MLVVAGAFHSRHYLIDTHCGMIIDVEATLAWLVDEKGIESHIPVWDKSERADGTFSHSDFIWNEQDNHYRWSAGKLLQPKRRIFKAAYTGCQNRDDQISRERI